MKQNAAKRAFFSVSLVLTGLLALSMAMTGCETEAAVESGENNITSFKIGEATAAISEVDNTISVYVPADTDLTGLKPVITVSSGASVSPVSEAATDFTHPTTYTVTAEDGSTRNFVVTVNTSVEVVASAALNLTLGLVADGNDGINVYGIPEGGIKLSRSTADGLPRYITISTGSPADEGGLGKVQWFVDGEDETSDTSTNIIILDASEYTLTQPHNITVIADRNGAQYSTAITFTVVK